jgi:tRNA(Ile)-lysidine synthase TilS/MesJ
LPRSRDQETISWSKRWELFKELVDDYRTTSNYDILIPVSGGKDSYYQVEWRSH